MSGVEDATRSAPTFWSASYHSRMAASNHQAPGHSIPFQQPVPFLMSSVASQSVPLEPSPHARPVRNVSEIIPRLYISDLAFAENHTLLASYQITHILSTLGDPIFHPPSSLLPGQPVRMQIKLEDLPFAELAAHLPDTTTFISDALNSSPDARVLVHCVEGVSRSVSVVAGYLMAEYGWSPSDAVEFIKTKRPVANPNFGFVQQLHEYAREYLSNSSAPLAVPLSAPP